MTLSRSTPLKRTAFKRSERKEAQAVAKLRRPMKSTRPRMTPIRKSARNEQCTLRFPSICNRNPETTAWCHSNRAEDGKGMALKARDEEGCYGCSDCHAWLDGGYAGKMPRETVDVYFDRARTLSQEILRRKGLLPTPTPQEPEATSGN